jgi:hypothetical protein
MSSRGERAISREQAFVILDRLDQMQTQLDHREPEHHHLNGTECHRSLLQSANDDT